MAQKQTRIVVTRPQFHRLTEHLRSLGVTELKATVKQLTKECQDILGFPISPSAIEDALEILGIDLVDPRGMNPTGDRVVRLAKVMRRIVEEAEQMFGDKFSDWVHNELTALTRRKGEVVEKGEEE